MAESDTLDREDFKRLNEAIHALEIARNPYLVFGFGGAHTIAVGALDDSVTIWNRYHPETPVRRRFMDEFVLGLWSHDAYLAR